MISRQLNTVFLICLISVIGSSALAAPFDPPPNSDAPRSTAGGASRPTDSSCTLDESSGLKATALAPQTFVGLTSLATPTLWIYLPNNQGGAIELTVFDQELNDLSQSLVSSSDTHGFLSIDLSEYFTLSVDVPYYWNGFGIMVSTPDHAHGAMLFDTANPTGGDMDLADPGTADVPVGKVLILSEDGDSADPDDNASGGVFRFDFDGLVGISGVNVLDIDAQESIAIRTFDESGMLVQSYGFEGAGNQTFQALEIQTGWIASMEIELTGSGAIASLEGDRAYRNIATATLTDRPGFAISDPSFYVNPYDKNLVA